MNQQNQRFQISASLSAFGEEGEQEMFFQGSFELSEVEKSKSVCGVS